MAQTSPSSGSRVAAPLGWGLAAAVVGAAVAPLDPNLLEEGIVVHTAQRMLAGDHLYRDVVSHTGPLPYELLAALFGVFGAKIAVARAAIVALQALGTGALFAAARRAGAGAYAHPVAACVAVAPALGIPLFSIYYYSTIAFYLGLLAVYAGVRSRESDAWAAGTGALLAGVALCKQNTGVELLVFALPAIAFACQPGRRLRRLSCVALGGGLVAAGTLSLYAVRGDLGAFLFAQVRLPFTMASAASFQSPYMNFWPPGELAPAIRESWAMYLPSLYHMRYGLFVEIGRGAIFATQVLYALPWIALLATAVRALRGGVPSVVWLHAAFLAAMTAGLYPRSDWGHLVVALPPAAAQLFLLAGSSRQRTPGRAAAWIAGISAVALLGVAALNAAWLHRVAGPPSFGPKVPLKPVTRANRGVSIPRVIRYLRNHTRPGDPIFVARQEPLLYFATETRNPTPFEGVLPGLRDWQEPLIRAALEDVRYAVMSDIDQPIYTFYSDELPGVWADLERHFRIPRDFPIDDYSWIQVLERGPDRGPTLVDLTADRATFFTRDAEGGVHPTRDVPQRLAARLLRRPLPLPLGPGGGGADFEVTIPESARFQAGVGFRYLVSIDHQYIHPPGITLAVAVDAGDGFETVASTRVDDGLRAGRRWRPFEADLSRFAGQRVRLRLEARAAQPIPPGHLSWFGSPRITGPAAERDLLRGEP